MMCRTPHTTCRFEADEEAAIELHSGDLQEPQTASAATPGLRQAGGAVRTLTLPAWERSLPASSGDGGRNRRHCCMVI